MTGARAGTAVAVHVAMTKYLLLAIAVALVACGEPTPDDALPTDGASNATDAGPAMTDATGVTDAPPTALSELPAEILALETRGIAIADDGTLFVWLHGGSGIHRARPPAYALERDWMPTNLGLHSELEVRGDYLYFIVEGALHRARIDAPPGVVLASPLATGLDGMALSTAPDGTLYYSKNISGSYRAFRRTSGGVEQELLTNQDGMIGDVAWHDGDLYVVSFGPRTVRAVELAATPPAVRAIGERDGALIYGVTVDAVGRIYYADSNRAFRFDPATGQNQVLGTGFLLVENLALGRGPLASIDVYLAAVPGALMRGAAAP